MRLALLAATAAVTTAFGTPSFAMAGYEEKLVFVSDLDLGGVSRDFSLCLLEKNDVALWMTYRTKPLRYVFAPDHCKGERYAEIEPHLEEMLKEADLLPELPDAKFNVVQSAILALLAAFGGLVMLSRLRRT